MFDEGGSVIYKIRKIRDPESGIFSIENSIPLSFGYLSSMPQ